MAQRVLQSGYEVDYTPSADVSQGDVVVFGDVIGLATRDITASTLGSINVGIDHIRLTEVPVSAESFYQGQQVFWDENNGRATATQNGWLHYGYTPLAYANTVTTIDVLRLPIADATQENIHSSSGA
jgi:predicted RecA/RadA family phage recombinase